MVRSTVVDGGSESVGPEGAILLEEERIDEES